MAGLTASDLREAALAAHRSGDDAKALRLYAQYLSGNPDDGTMWSNLGVLHRVNQRYEQSLRAHRRAARLKPEATSVLNNFANTLNDVGLYDESINVRHRFLALSPDDANQKALVGRAMRGKGDYDAAIDWLRRCMAEHPEESELELQLAFALLGRGDYEEGFRRYDARWRSDEMKKVDYPYPKWDGEDLAGKRVLVVPEQGFGDAVLTLRFLPALKARGAEVGVLVERPMHRLFAELEGADRIELQISRTEPFDFRIPYMDLPKLGLTSRADVPAPAKLALHQDSRSRARGFVGPYRDVLRVGVVWSGSATYKGNAFRSFSHTDLLPLSDVPGVQLFSLYKGPFLEPYRGDGSEAFILDTASSDRDFADCAATMMEMDLIVTSDTATAHIAGSLGIPTWVVLHWDSFWVYSHHGETTPWYPSMRLFRQPEPRNWEEPLARVRTELEAMATERKKEAAVG
ncbi:hypothetical protein [Pelagovum pacificum]|uniref:Uncharacterized protein n=1 Tax=Pelagovum pacificum TaxID=2588711 RepID=A0A5C5GHQ4_9RHOB|nr:hypothetical protein [Pelagovum pacificum]QQA42729.1 hypothetical protein I8N54_18465 [Pelagovum pacificum]TNY34120.1 hypothetical protein FHY64_12915 [Pelagovum pacificum]